jgi:transcriptional regulator with XRE-family HTH domain
MKKDDLKAIGERVTQVRKALRIAQKEIAAAIEMAPSYLSEIESGKANPGPGFFLRLSRQYNVSIEYLFHGRGEMFYDSKQNIIEKEFSLDEEVDSIDHLLWLMKQSPLIKNSIFCYASKFVAENEDFIRRSLAKAKKRREREKDQDR